MRRPSMSTSVEFTVKPRNATPDAPAAKPPPKAVGMVPLLSEVSERTTSDTVVSELLLIWSRVRTVTGDGVSLRWNMVPVTTTVSTWLWSSACAIAGRTIPAAASSNAERKPSSDGFGGNKRMCGARDSPRTIKRLMESPPAGRNGRAGSRPPSHRRTAARVPAARTSRSDSLRRRRTMSALVQGKRVGITAPGLPAKCPNIRRRLTASTDRVGLVQPMGVPGRM